MVFSGKRKALTDQWQREGIAANRSTREVPKYRGVRGDERERPRYDRGRWVAIVGGRGFSRNTASATRDRCARAAVAIFRIRRAGIALLQSPARRLGGRTFACRGSVWG